MPRLTMRRSILSVPLARAGNTCAGVECACRAAELDVALSTSA